MIQMNRCYVLFKNSDDLTDSKQCVLTSYVSKSNDIELNIKRNPMLGSCETTSASSSVETNFYSLNRSTSEKRFDLDDAKLDKKKKNESWKTSSIYKTHVEDTELSSISMEVQIKNERNVTEPNQIVRSEFYGIQTKVFK